MRQLRCQVFVSLTPLAVLAAAFLAAEGRAQADGNEQRPLEIVLDVGHPGPVISPLLFGANLEHTRYATWKGLFAQLLANRSFATPSPDETPAPAAGGQKHPPAWPHTGMAPVRRPTSPWILRSPTSAGSRSGSELPPPGPLLGSGSKAFPSRRAGSMRFACSSRSTLPPG